MANFRLRPRLRRDTQFSTLAALRLKKSCVHAGGWLSACAQGCGETLNFSTLAALRLKKSCVQAGGWLSACAQGCGETLNFSTLAALRLKKKWCACLGLVVRLRPRLRRDTQFFNACCAALEKLVVWVRRVELLWVAPLEPKSSASTNFAIPAFVQIYQFFHFMIKFT